ncbi:MAG: hypothetical protein H6655_26215 [Ardenticatenaceae bacterium]|nr:hypothetical protein [Ardenticatenaceae bacterium]
MIEPMVYSFWQSSGSEKQLLTILSERFTNRFELRSMFGVFVLRLIFWTIPLYFVFTQVIGKIRIRNVLYFALLNVVSNVVIIAVYSIILFPGLITLPVTPLTIVVTFISPFILYLFLFSRRYIQAFDFAAQDERKTRWNTDD